jgi:hypothetical protein
MTPVNPLRTSTNENPIALKDSLLWARVRKAVKILPYETYNELVQR